MPSRKKGHNLISQSQQKKHIIISAKKPSTGELIKRCKLIFQNEIIPAHLTKIEKEASKIDSYIINPFTIRYLAKLLKGNDDPKALAMALAYPRIFGTSISTIFGNRIQKMLGVVFEGYGSTNDGIDIEFIDKLDKRKKYCQLKAGPNNINKDDVKTIIDHFKTIRNRARTNNLPIRQTDMIVGILYGEQKELSGHFVKIHGDYPVIVGQDFWYRLTGDKRFYDKLIDAIGAIALPTDAQTILTSAISSLSKEIKAGL